MLLSRTLPRQVRFDVVVKRGRPRIWRILTVPARRTQVMNHVAACHQHDAFITQGRQLTPHFQVPGSRFGAVDAQLHHRNVCIRVHLNQHAPRAMVKAPGFFVQRNRDRCEELYQPLCQRRRAGSRIMRVIQRLRETAEIMNSLRRFHGRHASATGKPVRGHHHNRLRSRQRLAQMTPGAGIDVIFQNVHWAAMA